MIRDVIREGGGLAVDIATLGDGDDLYAAGLTSHATVNLMLGLEEKFDIEFPDRLLRRRTFESIEAISAAVTELLDEKVAA
ncbi:MAG: acyl carrier protein [Alphaproteobacteria bacterium]|nr:acyl carrier protein [Alphaproteobacteria bacterium]